MSAQRRENTGPELALRRALWRRGMRYRLHDQSLPGRPDLVLVRARLAVFVDGCFWHGCPLHGVAPKANAPWWAEKLAANRARDERVNQAVMAAGWEPVRVWEHEDAEDVADRLLLRWSTALDRPGAPSQGGS